MATVSRDIYAQCGCEQAATLPSPVVEVVLLDEEGHEVEVLEHELLPLFEGEGGVRGQAQEGVSGDEGGDGGVLCQAQRPLRRGMRCRPSGRGAMTCAVDAGPYGLHV